MMSITMGAQIPAGYYNNAEGKTGDALKVALHNIIKGHTEVGYDGLIDAYPDTDCDANGKIIDIYSNKQWSPYSGQCGSYKKEGDCWNREHTWPQSWFNEQKTPRCDLFHVYPTDGYVNNRRSSYPYGEVGSASYTSGNGSKLGTCKTPGYTDKVFEPIDEYKGDIARGFFYMSVRYYSEDSNWDSSDMTNKSVIKDWAMKMLLRWHEQDPVSQKEIDRNNVVYSKYQHNRNPFIDHPEYARMIWDENWTPASTYAIACATGLQHGSIAAPATASEGTTVAITATPDPGYAVDTYSVWKTGDTGTTVSVTSNGTFTMPAYDVTVSATFKENTTYYDIAVVQTPNGTVTASATTALPGTLVTVTPTPAAGYALAALHVFETATNVPVEMVGDNQFVMPAYDVTIAAVFAEPGDYAYQKVEQALSDWSGQYLIVYEEGSKAFNGNIDNKWGRCSDVSISDDKLIESNATVDGYVVTVIKNGTGYNFLLPSGKYMSCTTSSNFAESTSPVTYQVSLKDKGISISYGNVALYYNGSGGLRFYSSDTMEAIQLYKKVGEPVSIAHTITFHNGTETTTQTVNDFEASVLDACTFTRDGYVFAGWNTKADGTGDYYADEATVTLFADLDLYAQWDQLFAVTCLTSPYGTITATPAEATEDTPIILTAQPQPGYQLRSWSVSDAYGNDIPVMENSFDMPASNVQVSASWLPEGDVNDDGKVTIADAVALIAYLLGHPSEPFLEQAADIDGVEGITIGDAVEIVNRILASP